MGDLQGGLEEAELLLGYKVVHDAPGQSGKSQSHGAPLGAG